MADAPEIKVKLTAEDQGVSAAIKELGAQLKNLKKQQDETAASSFSLSKAFSAIATGAAALGLLKFGAEAFQSATNIGKLSDKTGISTQTLSVFNKVAEDVGASTESVDKSLIKAAKSITDFQQGGVKAAGGFKLLNLSAKDFAGLNADQKLQLVVTRLGGMQASFQKAAATAAIFGKGASDLTLVANSLAAQGFDKATESTAKLGLLLDQTTADTFRAAKASMQELEDAGKGIATQFEVGLLPAISDVGEALLDSFNIGGKNGDGLQEIGKVAGDVVRGIAEGFIWLGTVIGAEIAQTELFFSEQFDEIKIKGTSVYQALAEAVKGHFADAKAIYERGSRDIQRAQQELANQEQAIWDRAAVNIRKSLEDLFPSDTEEKRRAKERASRLRPDKQTEAPPPTPPPAPNDAAAKARLSLLEKQVQDELELHRVQAAQAAEIDKEQYDKGEISLKEYYARRRAEITAAAAEETAILQRGLAAAQAEVARTTAAANEPGQSPKDKDKSEAARLNSLAKVDELQTKISTTGIKATTDQKKLDDDEFKAKQANNAQLLEFEKQIDTTSAKRKEAAAAEIELEKQKLAVILAQSGASKEQIDAELQRFATAKANEAAFEDTRAEGAARLKELDDQKAAVEQKVQSGQLFSIQGQEQIRQIEAERLPILQQISAQLDAQAVATGKEENKATAADFSKQVASIQVNANLAGQQVAQLKQGLESSLVGGFTQFFDTVGRGTESVAKSFENLAGSIIGSLAKIAAQMLAQIVITKLLKSALGGIGGFSGGGSVPSVAGFAEGGLIRGPGGPKEDAIPARLSAGEFVVKADAVSAFGAHNLEAINRGLKVPSFEKLALPKFADGGLVGAAAGLGDSGNIKLGIQLDEGLILKHLSSKQAGRIVLDHITNNPKAASKALGRSQG